MPIPFDGLFIEPVAGGRPRWLVVLCHGLHADAGQLAPMAKAWGGILPTTGFVLPNAPLRRRSHWLGPLLASRREWFSISDRSPLALEAGVRNAAGLIDEIIDSELDRHALEPDAYALAGFSQGAMTVLFAGLRRARPPRAILGFAGSLIAPGRLESELRNHAPVLLVHGHADNVVSSASSRSAAEVLTQAHVPVTTCYRSGLGHEIDTGGIEAGGIFLRRFLL